MPRARYAARSCRSPSGSPAASLPKLPGIGHDLSEKIDEIVRTGDCALLQRLQREVPAGLSELLHLPGIGPKRVRQLYQELGVDSLASLRQALAGGRGCQLSGFGPPPI